MDDQDDALNFRQEVQHDRVHENSDEDDGPEEKGSMPALEIVVGMVHDDQALDDGTARNNLDADQ
ncbi:MAG: hypothetical protein L6R41_002955 [Letrouitia leprolyta]|nr:MAG: hypothetical protein L6R41_002955 [Letrouitia leprolyta]